MEEVVVCDHIHSVVVGSVVGGGSRRRKEGREGSLMMTLCSGGRMLLPKTKKKVLLERASEEAAELDDDEGILLSQKKKERDSSKWAKRGVGRSDGAGRRDWNCGIQPNRGLVFGWIWSDGSPKEREIERERACVGGGEALQVSIRSSDMRRWLQLRTTPLSKKISLSDSSFSPLPYFILLTATMNTTTTATGERENIIWNWIHHKAFSLQQQCASWWLVGW